MIICKQVRYSGRVQGVGFRYSAQHLAESFVVAGYVRNLPGGDVELAVEGEAEQVEAFLAELRRRMAGCVERAAAHDEPIRGYKGFHIHF